MSDPQPATQAKPVKPVTLPWRIVIDTAEQHAFSFGGLKADANKGNRPIEVETVRRCLGRYPESRGDYSLESVDGVWTHTTPAGWCFVERKSLEDCQSTLLGFADGHRERFESELANLAAVIRCGGAALVVVECDLCELLNAAPCHGVRSRQQNAKTLMRSILACKMDYCVPWLFCGGRRMAEIATFRFLERFWRVRNSKERTLRNDSDSSSNDRSEF